MDSIYVEILRQLESECKDELETAYGVEIPSEALQLACDITMRHYNGSFCLFLAEIYLCAVLENVH